MWFPCSECFLRIPAIIYLINHKLEHKHKQPHSLLYWYNLAYHSPFCVRHIYGVYTFIRVFAVLFCTNVRLRSFRICELLDVFRCGAIYLISQTIPVKPNGNTETFLFLNYLFIRTFFTLSHEINHRTWGQYRAHKGAYETLMVNCITLPPSSLSFAHINYLFTDLRTK